MGNARNQVGDTMKTPWADANRIRIQRIGKVVGGGIGLMALPMMGTLLGAYAGDLLAGAAFEYFAEYFAGDFRPIPPIPGIGRRRHAKYKRDLGHTIGESREETLAFNQSQREAEVKEARQLPYRLAGRIVGGTGGRFGRP